MLSVIALIPVLCGYLLAVLGYMSYVSPAPRDGWTLVTLLVGGAVSMIGAVPLSILLPFRWWSLHPAGRAAFVLVTIMGLALLPIAYGVIYVLTQ